jgi:hypothetical protein
MGGRDHPSGMGFQLHASERIQVVHSANAGSDGAGKVGEARQNFTQIYTDDTDQNQSALN